MRSKHPEPWRMSAFEMAAAVRHKAISCRELITSVLAHIHEVNPAYNALTEVLDEEALAAADAADQQIANGTASGVLHGVPVTTKINVDHAGRTATNGSPKMRDVIAREDSPVVSNLRSAGAISVGRTNTATYSSRWFTDNSVHGRTMNPWATSITPGGSSGGAAVAAASGMGAIAHGNDLGGSIRYPAYCCGVVGLRPTIGRIPAFNPSATTERTISSQLMSTQGALACCVADVRLAMQALCRFDPRDPNAIDIPWAPQPSPRGLRVALCRSHPGLDFHPAIVHALDSAASWLEAAGYIVEDVVPPSLTQGAALWRFLTVEDGRRGVSVAIADHGDRSMQISQAHMERGVAMGDRDAYLDALAQRFNYARDWAVFLDRYPILLLPTSCQPPIEQDADADEQDYPRFQALLRAQSPLLATACVGLPGISVPTGMQGSAPIGVQMISARFREDLLLDAAQVIESAAAFRCFLDR